MLTYQELFLRQAWQAAVRAQHVFPEMAACEAALESDYGRSMLAVQDNNLFGMKQHTHPIYGTASLPTNEFISGEWEHVEARWIHYPDWQACFADRMATLVRLAPSYSHYRLALAAPNGAEYVRQVSMTWATDPERAAKVLAVYKSISGDWSDLSNSGDQRNEQT